MPDSEFDDVYGDYSVVTGIDPLRRHLASFTGLHSLCLNSPAKNLNIRCDDLKSVQHISSLTRLAVRGNYAESHRDRSASFLLTLRRLRELELTLVSQDKGFCQSLVAACAHMSDLTSLALVQRIDECDRERRGGDIGAIAGGLGRLTALRALDMQNCRVRYGRAT